MATTTPPTTATPTTPRRTAAMENVDNAQEWRRCSSIHSILSHKYFFAEINQTHTRAPEDICVCLCIVWHARKVFNCCRSSRRSSSELVHIFIQFWWFSLDPVTRTHTLSDIKRDVTLATAKQRGNSISSSRPKDAQYARYKHTHTRRWLVDVVARLDKRKRRGG